VLEFFFRSLLRDLSSKIGLRRAATGHVFSYNVLCRKIYPTLPEPRNVYSLSVFNDFCPVGKLPNRRDHGSLSRNRPRIFHQQFIFEKKTLLHTVRRALSLCAPNSIRKSTASCRRQVFCSAHQHLHTAWGAISHP
jgi:hypothetical protein